MSEFDRTGWLHDVGLRVRIARKRGKLTQAELAEQAGLSRSAVANIEAGRQGVYADHLWRMAVVLDVPVHRLMPEPIA